MGPLILALPRSLTGHSMARASAPCVTVTVTSSTGNLARPFAKIAVTDAPPHRRRNLFAAVTVASARSFLVVARSNHHTGLS